MQDLGFPPSPVALIDVRAVQAQLDNEKQKQRSHNINTSTTNDNNSNTSSSTFTRRKLVLPFFNTDINSSDSFHHTTNSHTHAHAHSDAVLEESTTVETINVVRDSVIAPGFATSATSSAESKDEYSHGGDDEMYEYSNEEYNELTAHSSGSGSGKKDKGYLNVTRKTVDVEGDWTSSPTMHRPVRITQDDNAGDRSMAGVTTPSRGHNDHLHHLSPHVDRPDSNPTSLHPTLVLASSSSPASSPSKKLSNTITTTNATTTPTTTIPLMIQSPPSADDLLNLAHRFDRQPSIPSLMPMSLPLVTSTHNPNSTLFFFSDDRFFQDFYHAPDHASSATHSPVRNTITHFTTNEVP